MKRISSIGSKKVFACYQSNGVDLEAVSSAFYDALVMIMRVSLSLVLYKKILWG